MGFQVTEVQKALKGMHYPASRDDLVGKARENGAPDDLVEQLEQMDEESFDSPANVMSGLKGSLGGSTS